jgi:hypothetical protein
MAHRLTSLLPLVPDSRARLNVPNAFPFDVASFAYYVQAQLIKGRQGIPA